MPADIVTTVLIKIFFSKYTFHLSKYCSLTSVTTNYQLSNIKKLFNLSQKNKDACEERICFLDIIKYFLKT